MKLRDYQEQAADFLYEHDRAMILAPVGAGKTAITLTVMWEMLRDEHVKRFLVLVQEISRCLLVVTQFHAATLFLR